MTGIEVDLNAKAIGLWRGQMLFQHPALRGFEFNVSGPARRVGEPAIVDKPCVEQMGAHETAAVGANLVARRLHGLRHFLEIRAHVTLHEFARLRVTPGYSRTPQQSEELGVDTVDTKVYRAAYRLRKCARQLERALRITYPASLGHECAQAIIMVLEHDSDAHFELGNQSQLLKGQRLSRQGFVAPIIVTNDAVDADSLDLSQKVFSQLLGGIDGDVAFTAFAHRCRACAHGRNSEEQNHGAQEHASKISPFDWYSTTLNHVAFPPSALLSASIVSIAAWRFSANVGQHRRSVWGNV